MPCSVLLICRSLMSATVHHMYLPVQWLRMPQGLGNTPELSLEGAALGQRQELHTTHAAHRKSHSCSIMPGHVKAQRRWLQLFTPHIQLPSLCVPCYCQLHAPMPFTAFQLPPPCSPAQFRPRLTSSADKHQSAACLMGSTPLGRTLGAIRLLCSYDTDALALRFLRVVPPAWHRTRATCRMRQREAAAWEW